MFPWQYSCCSRSGFLTLFDIGLQIEFLPYLSFLDILTLFKRILGYLRTDSRTSIYLAISGAIGTKLLTIYKRNCLEQTKFAGVQNCLVHKLL